MKYLLIALLLVVIFLWISRTKRKSSGPPPDSPAASGEDGGRMVRCRHCGVHLPQEDAIAVDGAYFCCEEHCSRSGE